MKLNFQKLDIEIPVEIPVNFMISTGTGIPANRLILTGTGILPGSRSILGHNTNCEFEPFEEIHTATKVYYTFFKDMEREKFTSSIDRNLNCRYEICYLFKYMSFPLYNSKFQSSKS